MKFTCGFLIAACLVAAASAATPVGKCGTVHGPLPKEVRVEGCTETPCTLYRRKDFVAEWDFTVEEGTKTLRPQVMQTVFERTIPYYYFKQRDACETLKDASCPLEAGQNVTYKFFHTLPNIYPDIDVTFEFAFFDDNNNVAVCFRLPCKITGE